MRYGRCKKRGSGATISASLALVVLVGFLFLFVSVGMYHGGARQIEIAAEEIARDAIVCESIEDAGELAQEHAEEMLGDTANIDRDSIYAIVYYPPGATQEWKKGNFVYVSVTAFVRSLDPLTSKFHTAKEYIMIERNE